MFMLSFIVGHREVNIPQFSLHTILWGLFSVLFFLFILSSVFSLLCVCMRVCVGAFFYISNLSALSLACMVTKYKRKSMIEKKATRFRCILLSVAILFDAIPVLGSSVAFRSFSFAMCVCVWFCFVFFPFLFSQHISTYIDK